MENFDAINDFYRKNPPDIVLDHLGVRHINEIPPPAEYELNSCKCGTIHPIDADTWYHAGINITVDRIAVFRACKKCSEILTRKLVTKI